MKQIFPVVALAVVAGCASVPDTQDELIRTTDVKETKCYAIDLEKVSESVKSFLEGCYGTQTVWIPVAGLPVPLTSSFQVIAHQQDENHRQYSVRIKAGYGLVFNIARGHDACVTQVDMFALRSHLRDKFERVDAAIKGEDPKCGIV